MSQPGSLSDSDLEHAIAKAKWDVEYDARQIAETNQMEQNRGLFNKLAGIPAVDAQTKSEEIAEYEKDTRHLQSLVREAQRRGLDVT